MNQPTTFQAHARVAGIKRSRTDGFVNARNLSLTPTAAKRRLAPSKIHNCPPQPEQDQETQVSQHIQDQSQAKSELDELSEYSQRALFPSTPTSAELPHLSLSHPVYDLPPALVANLARLGVNSIYPWQAACLLGPGHLDGSRNLVYSAPTGGGKSLVADVLLLKRVLEDTRGVDGIGGCGRSRKAVLVLPYVALVQEKLRWLKIVVEGVMGVDGRPLRVAGFFGANRDRRTWAGVEIAVCTIEKANSLINSAIEENTIHQLGALVLDELHMLGDPHRGYLLEIMATKLLVLQQPTQIIAMSATLSNTHLLASWLCANYYISKYKPVPIDEFLVHENAIYPAASAKQFFRTAATVIADKNDDPKVERTPPCRLIDRSPHHQLHGTMANAMVALALETASASYGALIFCHARHVCQTNALLLADAMPSEEEVAAEEGGEEILEARRDIVAGLQTVPAGLDPVLAKTVVRGVAFHHAGLTAEERDLIATAYDRGLIKVLVATCSLAAGINLPARRVILCGARMGRDLVGPALLQMRGRAGRKGKDEVGETYLITLRDDLAAVADLLVADMPPVASGLDPGGSGSGGSKMAPSQSQWPSASQASQSSQATQGNQESISPGNTRGINRALLEAVATGLVAVRGAVDDFARATLWARCMKEAAEKDAEETEREEGYWDGQDDGWLEKMVTIALNELVEMRLLRVHSNSTGESFDGNDNNRSTAIYTATRLGRAIVGASLAPEDGVYIYGELARALRSFVMDGEMHVFYMFAPLSPADNPAIDWGVFLEEIDKLDESGMRVMQYIGIDPAFVNKMSISPRPLPTNHPSAQAYARTYTAFQLRDLAAETPIGAVAARYRQPRGAVQTLAQTCHGFAAGMVRFCQRMGLGRADGSGGANEYDEKDDTGGISDSGWTMLAAVLDHMRDRLQAGARAELLELARVGPLVRGRVARALWESGIRSVHALAEASVEEVAGVLMGIQPRWQIRALDDPAAAAALSQDSREALRPGRIERKMTAKAEKIVAAASRLWEYEMTVEIDD